MRNQPLLLRFAQPIPTLLPPAIRFDGLRQVLEVNQNGKWVKAFLNSDLLGRGDTKTFSGGESTDCQ
jgi:hypothetical protein